MKKLLFCTLFMTACVWGVPQTPAVCQRNLQDCSASYKEDKEMFCLEHVPCAQEDWDALCLKDLNVCKNNWGM